jgi:hypothetical protein
MLYLQEMFSIYSLWTIFWLSSLPLKFPVHTLEEIANIVGIPKDHLLSNFLSWYTPDDFQV